MSGYFEKTSGRAKCRECGKVISKDEIAYKVFGANNTCKQFHQECAEKIFKNILGGGLDNHFSEGSSINKIEIYTKPASGRAE
jgi:hypothetical protein